MKVHYNSDKPAQLQAHAYAQGSEIHVAPEQEQHLPHEAWHVVQQAQGRVRPTMQMKNAVSLNDDAGLEREADVMGALALQSVGDVGQNAKSTPLQRQVSPVVQRITEEDSRQARYNVRGSVGRHGYTVEAITSILMNRYAEILPGRGMSLLIGLGADEGRSNLGHIIYDCYLNADGETYTIDAFHAHGAQEEGNGRGY